MSRGPLVTLVVVLGAALALLMVNLVSADPATTGATGTAAPATGASAAPPASAGEEPPAAFPPKVKYIGQATTSEGPVPIAVTVDGDRAKAYLCDNEKIESWFQGSASGGAVDATGKAPSRLSARLEGDRLSGTVAVAGYPEWTFDASPSTDARAGVYRASNDRRTAGWIVQDGSGRPVGLGRTAAGAVVPATPLPADGPLPPGVAPVDGATDVLAGW